MTTAELYARSEIERIEEWRRERLKAAGFPSAASGALAERHDVDLHAAIELVEKGCPPDLAVRILL
jgi:hypothetical protein